MANRNQGLDLVRAAAVTTVLAVHGSLILFSATGWSIPQAWPPAASIAVELFYALSGFLVGGILLKATAAPTLTTWLGFMGRRWARTLPLYGVLVALAAMIAGPGRNEFLRFATLTQNLWASPVKSMFTDLLYPTWSLSIEECFYLLAASIMLGAVALFGRRAVWLVVVAFLAIPLALRLSPMGSVPDSYGNAFLNLDGIGWGMAVAMLKAQGSTLFRYPISAAGIGLALVVYAWWPYTIGGVSTLSAWRPETLTLAGAGCALVVSGALAIRDLGWLARPTRAISEHSYSAYLLHVPILNACVAAGTSGALAWPMVALTWVFVTVVLTAGSRKWIELPGMKLRLPRHARNAAQGSLGGPGSDRQLTLHLAIERVHVERGGGLVMPQALSQRQLDPRCFPVLGRRPRSMSIEIVVGRPQGDGGVYFQEARARGIRLFDPTVFHVPEAP